MRGIPILAAVVGLLLAAAPGARAGGLQESMVQDDDQLLHLGPERADQTLDELQALGVDRIRLSVIWRTFTPGERPAGDLADPRTYPAASFDALDHVVRGARQRNIGLLLNLRGGAPDWALGRKPSAKLRGRDGFRPHAPSFGRFAAMLGRRYSGDYADENQGGGVLPRVDAWSTWNEPNWGGHLQPQSVRVRAKRGRSRLKTVSPRLYRALHRAAVEGLGQTGHAGDVILLGETAPIGSRKLGELAPLRPIRFMRDLFCLDRRNRPVRGRTARRLGCDFGRRGALPATGYAHHPYPVNRAPGQTSDDPQWALLADGGRLEAVLDAAAASGRVPRRLPLWYTEFGYETSPPDPHRGISLDLHAAWLSDAEQLTWANPRVAAMTQFLLRDDEPREGFADGDRRRWGTYQTGLEFEDGRPKPAYEAYRLPIRAVGDRLWGMVRPGVNGQEQRIRIEHSADGSQSWRTVGERTVSDARGYFVEPLTAGPGRYRFVWVRRAAEPPLAGLLGGSPPEELASRAVEVRAGR